MRDKNIGFIGLGNLGSNLANNILLSGYKLYIFDIDKNKSKKLLRKGAKWCTNLSSLVEKTSIIINCLPSVKAISDVMESKNGVINYLNSKHLVIECSTTDEEHSLNISKKIKLKSANYIEAPLSGGEWRSKKGNISVFACGKKSAYLRALPILKEIGYEIIYLGNKIGSASTVKVLTNYLASINLIAISEVFMICKKYNLNLKNVYEAIRISSGNSFVHTSEGQLILSRSMNANFTMDLICKDLSFVEKLRKKFHIPSKLIQEVQKTFLEGKKILGDREYSTAIVKILEKKSNDVLFSKGFPKYLKDENPRRKGVEVIK